MIVVGWVLYFVLANQETIKREDDDCCEGWNGMVTTQIKNPDGKQFMCWFIDGLKNKVTMHNDG